MLDLNSMWRRRRSNWCRSKRDAAYVLNATLLTDKELNQSLKLSIQDRARIYKLLLGSEHLICNRGTWQIVYDKRTASLALGELLNKDFDWNEQPGSGLVLKHCLSYERIAENDAFETKSRYYQKSQFRPFVEV